jgi:putative addiction module component (TIGR02574 family)
MSDLFAELSQRAKSLPPVQRAQLAEALLESLLAGSSREIEDAWDHELQERIAAYEKGEASTLPAEDVLAEARRLSR